SFSVPPTTAIFPLSLHDALPIWLQLPDGPARAARPRRARYEPRDPRGALRGVQGSELRARAAAAPDGECRAPRSQVERRVLRLPDRKSTRLNSSHQIISYAVFCF